MAEKYIEPAWTTVTYSWEQLKTAFPTSLPHYKEREVDTLRRFVDGNYLPGSYSFDVRLPYEPTPAEKLLTNYELKMIIALKSMRIDAVVETPNEIWILEVANNLQLSYTGKLIGYADLYKRIYQPTKPVKMGVVALEDSPLAREALERMGIKIWIV